MNNKYNKNNKNNSPWININKQSWNWISKRWRNRFDKWTSYWISYNRRTWVKKWCSNKCLFWMTSLERTNSVTAGCPTSHSTPTILLTPTLLKSQFSLISIVRSSLSSCFSISSVIMGISLLYSKSNTKILSLYNMTIISVPIMPRHT